MRTYIKRHLSLMPFWLILSGVFVWLFFVYEGRVDRLFITSDQLGNKQYKDKNYALAADRFENVSFKGASYYKDAAFKKAKAVYQNLSTKEDTYNLGNTFVMLGQYDDAIKSYERALMIDPDFQAAKENLVVAKARKILKEPENDGEQGVGAMGADEIVFDNKEGKGVDDEHSGEKATESGNPNWLDRLQTGPKDFLKNKFRYQYEMKESGDAK